MRILVCGGRHFTDKEALYRALDKVHKERGIDVVIEGNAEGADRMAGYWARKNSVDNLKFTADWERHGRRAGPLRNKQMLAEGRPDAVVAFPGGNGTAHMVGIAKRAHIPVWEPLAPKYP